ncbi:MAG: prephenate dehydrogenase/arogenate dehydrogenase family protein [Planctomycetota bacterium]
MLDEIRRVVIVGTGLLGASVGRGLKEAGFWGEVTGVVRRESTLEAAKAVGAVDFGGTDLAEQVPAEGKVIVVVAVPVSKFSEVFAAIAPLQREGVYVTDVGSTKLSVVADAAKHLSQPNFFVPAHPMAGSEQSGPEAADGGLFRGRPCVLCPSEGTDGDALAAVRGMWEMLGAELHTMSANDHDRQVAAVSHLPHLVAVLLTHTANELGPLDLASSGFRDTSRLALSNPPMRQDIVMANLEPIGETLDHLAGRLNVLREMVRQGKGDELLKLLTEAQQVRQGWQDQCE